MKKDYSAIRKALFDFLAAWAKLKELGVLNSKKDFTSQIGEFIVAEIYNGLPGGNIQKGWDVCLQDGRKVQVKTHAKAETNNNQWTAIPYEANAEIDLFIILVFTHDYKLKHFFETPWSSLWELTSKDATRRLVRWNRLEAFDKMKQEEFKNNDLIKMFLS